MTSQKSFVNNLVLPAVWWRHTVFVCFSLHPLSPLCNVWPPYLPHLPHLTLARADQRYLTWRNISELPYSNHPPDLGGCVTHVAASRGWGWIEKKRHHWAAGDVDDGGYRAIPAAFFWSHVLYITFVTTCCACARLWESVSEWTPCSCCFYLSALYNENSFRCCLSRVNFLCITIPKITR